MLYIGRDQKKLTHGQFGTLIDNIKLYQPSLVPLFELFESDGYKEQCPDVFREFLDCISKNYPCSSILRYDEELFNILLEEGPIANSLNKTLILRMQFPSLYKLKVAMNNSLPEELLPILKELVRRAKIPFKTPQHDLSLAGEPCPCTDFNFGFFPKFKNVSHRGNYVLDNENPRIPSKCTKKCGRHQNLSPGLFTISCVHGIIIVII